MVVEGYMPDDENASYPDNTVYFDNISFFRAPPIKQVYWDEPTVPDDPYLLYGDSGYSDDLDLQLNLDVEVIQPPTGSLDSYVLFAGSLINDDGETGTAMDPRSIDLGFAFPILDNTSSGTTTQQLEWHYDVNHASLVDSDDASIDENRKMFPYTMSSHVDARPEYKMSGVAQPLGVDLERTLGLQVSSYPIGAVAIHDPADPENLRGLSFGDSLDGTWVTPNISHFGYRIDRQAWGGAQDFIGYAYIEFNLGLLAEDSASGNSTDFSFIIFRSDDEDFSEQSVFREGMEKYQRSFYQEFFTRPTFTREGEEDWLFGGAQYDPDVDDLEQDGLDDRPNQFGIRYDQIKFVGSPSGIADIRANLIALHGKNVSAVVYDLPWAGSFEIKNDGEESNRMNSMDELWIQAEAELDDISFPQSQIYLRKLPRIFTSPLGEQKLFYKICEERQRYFFPVSVTMTPDPDESDILVTKELSYFKGWYKSFEEDFHLIAGVEFDNTYRDSHLDLNIGRVDNFAHSDVEGNEGRLTYSYNEFRPAVPQLTTNTWFFPHVEAFLDDVDNDEAQFPDHGDGADSGYPGASEEEIISINAMQKEFGGSKYAIMLADVIMFESSTQTQFNNKNESFDFRRSMARDKSVARGLAPYRCAGDALDNYITYGNGPDHLYTDRDQVLLQLLNEATWSCLAYGFMPAMHNFLSVEEGCFVDDDAKDEFYGYLPPDPPGPARRAFWTSDSYILPRRGYTDIFKKLHKAGWQPVTNIVNLVGPVSESLVINRFGPYEGFGPPSRPIFVTVYNNETFSLTLTDVAEYGCEDCIPIGSLQSDEEIELYSICENNFGSAAFQNKEKRDLDSQFFDLRDRSFLLEINNIDKLALNGVGNLMGHQMIEHIKGSTPAVNAPNIPADIFDEYGDNYSVTRSNGGPGLAPKIILGGGRAPGEPQGPRTIEDKALMVFRIWLSGIVDNSKSGDGGEDHLGVHTTGLSAMAGRRLKTHARKAAALTLSTLPSPVPALSTALIPGSMAGTGCE